MVSTFPMQTVLPAAVPLGTRFMIGDSQRNVFVRVSPLIVIVPVHVPPPLNGAAFTVTFPKNCDAGDVPDNCPLKVAVQPEYPVPVNMMLPSTARSF